MDSGSQDCSCRIAESIKSAVKCRLGLVPLEPPSICMPNCMYLPLILFWEYLSKFTVVLAGQCSRCDLSEEDTSKADSISLSMKLKIEGLMTLRCSP